MSTTLSLDELTVDIQKELDIAADVETTWQAMLEQITAEMEVSLGNPLNLRLEPWPGGRYFRDLGEGVGHLWGHVQVIKPPKLLEFTGPMFMSTPVINHVQYRIEASGNGCVLKLTHRGFGLVPTEHIAGMHDGWQHEAEAIKRAAEAAAK